MRRFVLSLFAAFLTCLHPAIAASWQPDDTTLAALRTSLDTRRARLFEHTDQGNTVRRGQTSIDAASFALDALAARYDASAVSDALRALLAMQDSTPSSRSYGNMHWYAGDVQLVDRNGIEFVMRKLVLIPALYADRLNAEQRASLDRIFALAKDGITRHNVAISYTNIFLMKTWNLIALGDALHDATLGAQGRTMLREWLAYTAQTGINEYLSPTYFEVDLDNLSLIANLARDEKTRADAQRGLDFFWHDIALHWFAPGERLGGVHSRDYDRLFNTGALNSKMAATGWLAGKSARDQRGPYEYYAWATPPEAARKWLSGPFPRFIYERWGDAPEKRLSHYMGRNFGISSAEAGYSAGHDNAPLVINMGSGADVPIIDFFMDGRRDHYGTEKTLEAGSGHMKALHLKPFITSVQNDNEVLFLASIQNDTANNVALESNITLPADAEYWIDDQKLQLFTQHSAWNYDIAPNGKSTRINVLDNPDGTSDVQLIDEDDKQGVGLARNFDVEPGNTYRISASLLGDDVFLYLNFYDAAHRLIGGEHAQRVSGGGMGYIVRSFSYTAPPGAVSCKAWLYSTSSNRTQLRINDLRFERMKGDNVDKLLGGFDFRAYRPQQIALPEGSTLILRRENVAVALRPLLTLDVGGRSTSWTLYNDGLQYHAMRLTAQHAEGQQAGRGSAVVWAYAEEGIDSDTKLSAFRRRVAGVAANAKQEGTQIEAKVAGITGSLRIGVDVERGQRWGREGQKQIPEGAVLWVNGENIGPMLFGDHRQ